MADRSVKVTLLANVNDFKRQISSAGTSLDDLARTGDRTGQASQTLMGRMVQSAQLQREAWTTAGSALTGFGAAVTGVGVAALSTGVSYNTLQQTSRAALTTLTGSAEEANAQMDKLDEFATTSPFAKDVFIRAQQQMLGFGIEAQNVVPYLDAIQNAVAATGGSNQDISELSRIFSQISASAKITATDLREFGNRGIDAATIIGSQMGMTGAQIRDEITAGTLDAGQALDALAAGMQDTYGGAADNVKNTFAGAWDRVKAAWRDLSSELAAPLVGPNGGGLFVGLLNEAADVMRAFQDLPGPIKGTVAALGGVAGVGSLAAGGFLLLFPRVMETYSAFKQLQEISPRIAGAIGKIAGPAGKAAGALGKVALALGVAVAVETGLQKIEDAIYGIDRHVQSVDELAISLRDLGDEGTYFGAIFGDLADEGAIATDRFTDLGEAVKQVADPNWGMRLDRAFGLNTDGIEQVEEALLNTGELLASLPTEEAAAKFRGMWAEAGGTTEAGNNLLEAMPAYRDSLLEAANAAGVTSEELDILALATGDVPPEMAAAAEEAARLAAEEERLAGLTATTTDEIREQIEGLRSLYDLMREMGDGFMSLQDAQAAWGEEVMGLGDVMEGFAETTGSALNEAGDNWDFFSERGLYANDAINELTRSGLGLIDSMRESGATAEELEAQMATVREEVIDLAVAFGMPREEAEALADSMGLIPENVTSRVDINSEESLEQLAGIQDAILQLPDGEITLNGNTQPAEDAITGIAEQLATTDAYWVEINGNIVPVSEAINEVQRLVEAGVDDIELDADPALALGQLHGLGSAVSEYPALMPIDADPTLANNVHLGLLGGIAATPGVMTLDAEDSPARGRVADFTALAKGTTGTSTLDADPEPAHHSVGSWLETARLARGVSTLDADSSAARGETRSTIGWINSQSGSVGIGAHILGASVSAAIGGIAARAANATASVGIGGIARRATGGEVWGAGSATSDSIPALLSNGEFVVRTAAADHYGRGLLHAINNMSAPKHVPTFATGGQVGRMESARSYATSTVVQQVPVPTHLTVVDADRALIGTMEVVSHREHRAQTKHEGAWRR
ncbi:MAG: tape measure protein [Brevibacterium yomogidense]